MTIFTVPILRAFDSAGAIVSGAKLYTRVSGSSTPAAVYSDAALSTEHANPVVANSAGVFPAIYFDPTVNYRLIQTDGTDAGDDPSQETALWQATIDNYKAGDVNAYDFTVGISGAVGTSQKAFGPMAPRAFTMADDFAGSYARLETAPDASTEFSVQVDGVEVGTITFASSSQSGVFASSAAVSVSVGSYVDVVAPADPNSCEDLRVTFKATLD